MDKEVITKAQIKREVFYEIIDNLELINNLTDYGRNLIKQGVIDLRDENTKYKEVIDKAREHILTHLKQDMLSDFTGANYVQEYMSDPDELLNILKEK